jgi:L-glutamine-phosphate cytidylyltransferase
VSYKAVIVAAGRSSRLYPRTLDFPKPLLPLQSKTLIEKSVDHLLEFGVASIAVVVGYHSGKIRKTLEKYGEVIHFIENPFYAYCNNMGSLWFAREFIGPDPFLYLHGDLAYTSEALELFRQDFDKRLIGKMLVDFGPTDDEAMKVIVDDDNYLLASSKEIQTQDAAGEWTGISALTKPKPLFEVLSRLLMDGNLNSYDTAAFSELCQTHPIECVSITHHPWIEIDFEADYLKALEMFP